VEIASLSWGTMRRIRPGDGVVHPRIRLQLGRQGSWRRRSRRGRYRPGNRSCWIRSAWSAELKAKAAARTPSPSFR
jgi:hypothetical protein